MNNQPAAQKGPGRLKQLLAKKRVRIILGVLIVVIALRILLPYVLLHYANRSLANLKGYYGHIEDIDLSLYRGSYQVQDMYLNKRDTATGKQTKFFTVASADLSVEWKALFKGKISGEMDVYRPEVTFTADTAELEDVKKDSSDFRKILKDFMPLSINRFQIHDGRLRYVDHGARPKVDVSIKNIDVLARNLNNSYDSSGALPGTIRVDANAYEGSIGIDLKLNLLAEEATFDMNAELQNMNLVLVNDFLFAYAGVDVNKGTFGLYSELASKNGSFKGYVKPIIKDLDVTGIEDKKDPFFRKLWEGMVGVAGDIFKNQKKDQVATEIPFEGDFKNPKTNAWEAVWEVLKNAFVRALMPTIDDSINLSSVDEKKSKDDKNFLQKIFSKDDD